MRQETDKEFAQYLLENLAPDLREAGYTSTAGDVEDAGHRLLAAAEVVAALNANVSNDLKVVPDRDTESGFKAVRPVRDGEW